MTTLNSSTDFELFLDRYYQCLRVVFWPWLFQMWINLVPRVLSYSVPVARDREREPGLVTCPLDKWCKGGVFWFQNFVDNIFVTFKERLFGKESRIISFAIIKTCVMFFNSLHFAIPSSIYSNINLKANQIQYLKAIYRGGDVVAVLPREAEWERTLGTRLNLNSSNHWTNFYPV